VPLNVIEILRLQANKKHPLIYQVLRCVEFKNYVVTEYFLTVQEIPLPAGRSKALSFTPPEKTAIFQVLFYSAFSLAICPLRLEKPVAMRIGNGLSIFWLHYLKEIPVADISRQFSRFETLISFIIDIIP